jgi:hypothetical protein
MMAVPDTFKFGEGMSPFGAANWALAMTRVNGDQGLTCGVPISDLAVHWDSERAPALFKLIAADNTKDVGKDLCTPSGIKQ